MGRPRKQKIGMKSSFKPVTPKAKPQRNHYRGSCKYSAKEWDTPEWQKEITNFFTPIQNGNSSAGEGTSKQVDKSEEIDVPPPSPLDTEVEVNQMDSM